MLCSRLSRRQKRETLQLRSRHLNLISNAIKYTDTGGVRVTLLRDGGEAVLTVSDTGRGSPDAETSRVFEEFYQVEPQGPKGGRESRGMGLGLATVQRLAALLNTRVELISRPHKGTCVRVPVRATEPAPMLPAPFTPPFGVPAESDASLADTVVLVIDDERTILEGLQVVLANWGAQVMAAQSRAEALALADAWDRPPDVVVSDLLLQGGDNGLDVLAALERHPRGIGPSTARLLVTGETKPDRLREVASAGVAVLYKPVSPRLLRQAIQVQLAAVRGASVPAA